MKKMTTKKLISRCAALFCSIAMLLTILTVPALAYERIDTSAETSLILHFTDEGTGLSGASFRLYRVADVSDTVEFALTDDFAKDSVSLDDMKSAGAWSEMASTLSDFVSANSISPAATGTTGADGSVTFSDLTVGLYLLVGDSLAAGDETYAPAATMMMLPTLQEDDSWNYSPSAEVKYTKSQVTKPQDETGKPETEKKPLDQTLPRTGMLIWPIPVLAISGLLLAGAGWYLRAREKDA